MHLEYDKYFTNSKIASLCCNLIKKHIEIDFENDLIIEPSAGSGSFIKPIKSLCQNCYFIDINPESNDILKKDYLTLEIKNNLFKKIHVIGNPPFGIRSSKAIKFIKKSCTFCDTFSFILPRSFGKPSMKKTVPLNFHLKFSYKIPENSFELPDKTSCNVPCIFQVWEKRNYLRTKPKQHKPNKYTFTKSSYQADLAVRRVGSYSGKVYKTDIEKKNINTHYFIKLDNINDINRIKDIKSIYSDFVLGAKSISKQTIIKSLNKQLL